MNDEELKKDTIVALILICALAVAFAVSSGEGFQRRLFLSDCGDTYTQEHCEKLWRMGNG